MCHRHSNHRKPRRDPSAVIVGPLRPASHSPPHSPPPPPLRPHPRTHPAAGPDVPERSQSADPTTVRRNTYLETLDIEDLLEGSVQLFQLVHHQHTHL